MCGPVDVRLEIVEGVKVDSDCLLTSRVVEGLLSCKFTMMVMGAIENPQFLDNFTGSLWVFLLPFEFT